MPENFEAGMVEHRVVRAIVDEVSNFLDAQSYVQLRRFAWIIAVELWQRSVEDLQPSLEPVHTLLVQAFFLNPFEVIQNGGPQ